MQSSHNRPPALQSGSNTFDRIEQLHPHKMLLYLAILGSLLLFAFMLIAFSATYNFQVKQGIVQSLQIPKAFVLSTIVLLLSSFYVSRFNRAWRQEKLKKLRNLLATVVGLGFIFTISQYWGWHVLDKSGHSLSDVGSGAYLYVISGMHILHLIGAMFFMTYQFINISNISTDPVRTLVAITNPHQKLKLDLLAIYWHFMDFLWLGLFFFFLFWF